jgi:hypothetical protein
MNGEAVVKIGPGKVMLARDVAGFEIVVTERRSHWIGFKVYKVIGRTESSVRIYNRDGYQSSPDPVEGLESAQVALSGSVKWDGCSDITIDDEPLHFCGRSNMEEFAALLSAIYDLAAELIPSYEGG